MNTKRKTAIVGRLLRILSIITLAILVIILAAVVGLFVYEPSPAEGFAFSSAGKTIQLSDGRTLAYLESGDPEGRPVFYFNGAPGSRLEGLLFDELNLQMGVRMISIDRPGYGLSDFQEDRTYLDWPVDVSELADHLGIDRFAVLGWSSGGPYAAVVAHEIPERLTVVGIVDGEVPYQSDDFPQSTLNEDTFAGSKANDMFIWSANNAPWLMRTLLRINRIMLFSDPAGSSELGGDIMAGKDMQFFSSDGFIAGSIEAFRPGVDGMTRDFTLERIGWPFEYEGILAPTVLVFHGGADSMIPPSLSDYVCMRIPTCDEPKIYPGEGHSVVYYRYEEIIQAMLAAWE